MPRLTHYDLLLELVAGHEFESLGCVALKGLSKRVRASALAGAHPGAGLQLRARATAA
jgi:hypothetical protein